ncbi:MAG: DUF559 domain-containing protein [Actinomycetes bacterium]
MSALPRPPAFDPRQPFSRAEAREAGISVSALLSKRFRKIGYDTYLCASVSVTLSVRAQVALKVSPPGSHLSHHTAATLWGAEVPTSPHVHVTTPSANGRSVRGGIKAHVCARAAGTTVLRGLPVSTPAQTFLDLAAYGLELVDLVVVGDCLVKARRVTPEALVAAADAWRGAGCRLARRAAKLVRAGVDSSMETRLRLLVVLAGLPEPRVNLILRAADGSWRRRFDLCYEDLRIIVEYDGRQHAEDDEQWRGDILRREELERLGWRLVVITWHGIFRSPEATLVRIRAALRSRGAKGLPREFAAEWQRHFPGR